MQITKPSSLEENARADRLDALADVFKVRAGALPLSAAHPEARAIITRGGDGERCLFEVAAHHAITATRPGQKLNPDQAFALGWNTSDFGQFMGAALTDVVYRRQQLHVDHRAFCSDKPVRNFLAVNFPSVDFAGTLEEVAEMGEVTAYGVTSSAGLSGRLRSFATALVISRQAAKNDEIELIAEGFAAVGAAAAQKEASDCYALLESNPTLADGEPMFHDTHMNLIPDVISLAAIGTAMNRLRTNPTATGAPGNLEAKTLLVSSGLELTARSLLRGCDSADKIRLVASPHITPGRWFLFADPAQAPVIGRLTLRGNSGVMVAPTSRLKNLNIESTDGRAMKISVDHGFVALGRIGVVRGGL